VARRIETGTVTRLRDHLTQWCAELLARFAQSDAELFPCRGAEVRRLRKRLDDLKNGRDILVYRFEVPAELQPPRTDEPIHVFTLRGDRLVTADYEHAVPMFDDRW
jgi:hypothetical protein